MTPLDTSSPASLVPDGADSRPLLKVVIVGSVDDGKSTLLGRLLYECDGLYEDQIAAVRARSTDGVLDLSLFTDGLLAEREQGITIDVAWRYLQTPKLKLVLADTPGHVQYTRNMATGASTAEAVIILVDARLGVLQQTRRHAKIAALLGIPNVCVAINKIDLVDDPAATFSRLREDVQQLVSQLGYGQAAIIPVSAVVGDNVTRSGTLTPFYVGPTVLSWLEAVPAKLAEKAGDFRFPVQTVLRPHLNYRGYAGAVVGGEVHVGDDVVILPAGTTSRIAGIDTFTGSLPSARAPQAVVLRLTDDVDVGRGDVIAAIVRPPQVVRRFEADLVWFGETPLTVDAAVILKHTTRSVRARVSSLRSRLDLDTLQSTDAVDLRQNDIGRVVIDCSRPIVADLYDDNRDAGAFILVDPHSNDTIAAGMIRALHNSSAVDLDNDAAVAARAERFGHGGAVVLTSSTAAVETSLLAQGIVAAQARTIDAAITLADAGVVAVLAGSSRQQLDEAGVRVVLHEQQTDADLAAAISAPPTLSATRS